MAGRLSNGFARCRARCCRSAKARCIPRCTSWNSEVGSRRNGRFRKRIAAPSIIRSPVQGARPWQPKRRIGRGFPARFRRSCGWLRWHVMRRLLLMLRSFVQQDRELDEELQYHLDMQIQEGLKCGLTPDEALAAAKRALGAITQHKEEIREARPLSFLNGVLQDVQYALRGIRRNLGFSTLVVLIMALGIAATTTVFGWIDGMVLHPFRGATDDGQLAVLEAVRAGGIEAPSVSYADSRDFQDGLRSISGLALNQKAPASIGDGENPYSAWFELVSGNYFDVLGVKPILGRTFAREENGERAKAFTAVISYRLWQNYFRSDRSILGRIIHINRYPVTIVGVAPAEFQGDFPGTALDAWVPAPLASEVDRRARHFGAIVRLK